MRQNVQDHLEESELDYRRLIGMVLDNRWLVAAYTLVFLTLSVVYALVATPIFSADALVQVEQQSSGLSSLAEISNLLGSGTEQAVTEIAIIQSRLVLGQAVDAENLTIEVAPGGWPILKLFSNLKSSDIKVSQLAVPSYLETEELQLSVGEKGSYTLSFDDGKMVAGTAGKLLSAEGGSLQLLVDRIDAPPGSHFYITHQPREQAILTLFNQLKVEEQGKESGVIRLELKGTDKDQLVGIISNVTQAYVNQNIQWRAEEAQKGLDFLRAQLPKVKSDLYKSEEALNELRLQHGSLDIDLEAKSVLEQGAILQQQLDDLGVQQVGVSRLYSPQHPFYKGIVDQRAVIERQLETLRQREADMPDIQQKMLRRTRDVEVNEQLYLQMFDQIQELDVARAGTVGNVRILDDAEVEWKPVWPLKALVVFAGTFFGLLLGVAIIIVRDRMNPGVEGSDELEAVDVSVLAAVPRSDEQIRIHKDLRKDRLKSSVAGGRLSSTQYLLGVVRSEDVAIEALRSLRTSLHFSMLEARNNLVMISGPSPEVGKTFISTNFSIVLAHAGQRVLLIDADLRRGTIHQQFNLSPYNGLSELLNGKLSRDAVIMKSGVEGLDVVGRGSAPISPAELMMRPAMAEFLEWASANYDIVLIDTPPILAVTDAAIVGRLVGTTLLIVRYRVSSVKEVQQTIRRFAQNGVNVIGCVLNGLELGGRGYGYKYGYYTYEYKSTRSDDPSSS